jgi:uncharacterized protein YdhG (YjbR/CyaY superfamily)
MGHARSEPGVTIGPRNGVHTPFNTSATIIGRSGNLVGSASAMRPLDTAFTHVAPSLDQLDAVIRLIETETVALDAGQRKPTLIMIADHDAYIAEASEDLRPLLVQLRAQLALALPDAEEVIAYKMPGFRIGKSIVAGYAAFSKQCGLYLSPSAITSHADDIAAAGLKSTKTGVTFSPSQPIPDGLIEKLALASRRYQNL